MAKRMTAAERNSLEARLGANVLAQGDALRQLFDSVSDHWGYEDPIYRFYHQSFKLYPLAESTTRIVAALQQLLPDQPLNPWFMQIVEEGPGKKFQIEDNERWLEVTRPILEAFFHARYFLEMACRYDEAPAMDQPLPSGWAALLHLFNIR